jgi:hypothetical protein
MIFALGTPINAQTKPWSYDWIVKPDAIMISAIDFLESPSLYEKVKNKGIHEVLEWDGPLICDSGAFSAINRKKSPTFDLTKLKGYYHTLSIQDPNIIKITLDYPDEKILSNYEKLLAYNVQPVIPFNQLNLITEIETKIGSPEWYFIGRLVPLMRGGGGYRKRLFKALTDFKTFGKDYRGFGRSKIWALGVGAPSILSEMMNQVDGCDSSRWRITGSNMILLPSGGERGIGNKTKWRGTHHRINEGNEVNLVVSILKFIDSLSGGIETLDKSLKLNNYPKQLRNRHEFNLPCIGDLIRKIRNEEGNITAYDLELLLRSSGKLRFIFNYIAALNYKLEEGKVS